MKLNEDNIMVEELRAILKGLRACWELQLEKVIVESDAQFVIEAMKGQKTIHGCKKVMLEIMYLME